MEIQGQSGSSPLKQNRPYRRKKLRYRNKKYLKWITESDQSCVMCGEKGWDDNQIIAHHCISIRGLNLGGMGMKAPDTLAVPMHVLCHTEFHNKFHLYKEDQPIWLMRYMERTLMEFLNGTLPDF